MRRKNLHPSAGSTSKAKAKDLLTIASHFTNAPPGIA
jgi:hypothetical protein